MAASDPTRTNSPRPRAGLLERRSVRGSWRLQPDFRDHVNARDYCGHDGIRRSLGLYQLVFRDGDLRIRVEDQVAEGDRVASRWVAEGHNRGRPLRIWGIVISRIDDGEIIEDWAASDTLELIRQLGPLRLLLLAIDWLRSGRRSRA